MTKFKGVKEKIDQHRDELNRIQTMVSNDPENVQLMQQEKEQVQRLRNWLRMENSVVKQKSRVRWFRDGYTNSSYFHSIVNARNNYNRILNWLWLMVGN